MPIEIILASSSPRRAEIFKMMGLNFRVMTAGADESTNKTDPAAIVEELAARKAEALTEYREAVIVSADTVVALEGKILGKPQCEEEAYSMLSRLSGRRHEVFTGVCIKHGDDKCIFHEKTSVYFSDLSDAEIKAYISSGESMDNAGGRILHPKEWEDKAGGYGIQTSFGAIAVKRIEGDFYNVMGFPVCAFYNKMKENYPHLHREIFWRQNVNNCEIM